MDDAVRAPPSPPTPGRARVALRLAALSALAVVLAALTATALAWWGLRSERGAPWLLARVPGLQVEGVSGRLLGDLGAKRAVVRWSGGTVTLFDVSWHGLIVQSAPGTTWFKVDVGALSIGRVDVALQPSGGPSAGPPQSLRSPVEIELHTVRVGELRLGGGGDPLLRALQAHLHLAADGGAHHRIDSLAFTSDTWQAGGHAQIATAAPQDLQAQLTLSSANGASPLAWSAQVTANGALASPVLDATVRALPSNEHPAQSADLHAVLHPFSAWPLGDVQVTTQSLDLSAFGHGAPATALTGRATARSVAVDQPANVSIDLGNASPGRWSDAAMPVRRLRLELLARPTDARTLDVRQFDAELGTRSAVAGHVNGTGVWSREHWEFAAQLQSVKPDLLDARAPAVALTGPLRLSGTGSSPAVTVRAELAGIRLFGGHGPRGAASTELVVDASVSADRLELRTLQARAGGARAVVSGLLTYPTGGAPLSMQAQANLVEFDPTVWWPGPEDSTWRKSAPRLNAQVRTDLTVAGAALQGHALSIVAATRGQAELTLNPSVVAGVAVEGRATLQSAPGAQVQLALRVHAGADELTADGHLDVDDVGAGDAWSVALNAPSLQTLAPVWQLLRPAQASATLSGTAAANARVAGRWPRMSTQGQFEATTLRAGGWGTEHALATWTLGSTATAPVNAHVRIAGLHLPSSADTHAAIDAVTLQLSGTGHAHTLDLQIESALRAPGWAVATASATGASSPAPSVTASGDPPVPGTTVLVQARGGLQTTSSQGATGWSGELNDIDVRSAGASLLRAQAVSVQIAWDPGAPQARWQPGRATVLGTELHWSQGSWTGAGSGERAPVLEGEFTWDSAEVAPWLARAQPDFGWGGDLMVGGRLTLRAPSGGQAGINAELAVRRDRGDLTVTDELGTRALGLSELELRVNVSQGVWSFAQRVDGKALGVLSGNEVIHAPAQALWPPADATLQGTVAVDVTDLGTWGNWVPPGWRLGGTLQAHASIGGKVGGPEFTGAIVGRTLSVHNFLEGIAVDDGDVVIRMDGRSAQIERFTAKAGRGTLTVQGEADLGARPDATLRLTADKFQVLGRVDRRLVASGTARLHLDRTKVAVDGALHIDEGLIDFTRGDAPGLSDDVQVVRPEPTPTSSRPTHPASTTGTVASRDVALDVKLDLGDKLRLRGHGLDSGLRGDLQIAAPAGRLTVNGTVHTVDGTYNAYNQKLNIDRGAVVFNGSADNPRLDIEATRPNLDIRVGVQITGTATNPRVRLFSEPDMADIDKLSWLVLGRASDGLGSTDTALLQHAALALLAGEGGGLTGQLTRAIGLDDVSVRQQTEGNVQDTVISLGKQLSQRWYVGYEHGLNATAGSFQIIYRVAQRFTLRAQSGADNSLDLLWSWRWP